MRERSEGRAIETVSPGELREMKGRGLEWGLW